MHDIAKIAFKPNEKCSLEPVLGGARKQENRARGARMPEITKIAFKPNEKCNLEPVSEAERKQENRAQGARMPEIAKIIPQTKGEMQSGVGFGKGTRTGKPRPCGQGSRCSV